MGLLDARLLVKRKGIRFFLRLPSPRLQSFLWSNIFITEGWELSYRTDFSTSITKNVQPFLKRKRPEDRGASSRRHFLAGALCLLLLLFLKLGRSKLRKKVKAPKKWQKRPTHARKWEGQNWSLYLTCIGHLPDLFFWLNYEQASLIISLISHHYWVHILMIKQPWREFFCKTELWKRFCLA